MRLHTLQFSGLSNVQLYKILKLRFDVFVMEQKSIYDEFDSKDFDAAHIFFQDNEIIAAYLRVFKKDEKTAALGRLVVHPDFRKQGLGRKLALAGIEKIRTWKSEKIEIGAQLYLKKFYESLGFRQVSEPYDDCGVQHIDMVLDL